jgi:hypothetical protein
MYVAIRQYGLVTNEPLENVMRGIREGFIPIIKNAPGFLAYYALDSGGGTLTSISIFEYRAGAERSNKLAEDWVGRTLSSALPTSPQIIVGEVGAHELSLTKLGIRELIE